MRRRRTAIDGQFAARQIEMLESPAYRKLSLSAHRILSRLEIEFAHHGGTDNGRLPVTYKDFQVYGIDYQSIAPAIRQLEALGFIEVTQRGRAGNAEFRSPSRYRLTNRPTDKADATHEWRRIKTIEEAEAVAAAARKASKKEKTKGGKPHISVGEINTDNASTSEGEIHPTASGVESPATSISRGGVDKVA